MILKLSACTKQRKERCVLGPRSCGERRVKVFQKRSLPSERKCRCTDATASLARSAARRSSEFFMLRTRQIIVPRVRLAGDYLPTARFRACSRKTGRAAWKNWKSEGQNRRRSTNVLPRSRPICAFHDSIYL